MFLKKILLFLFTVVSINIVAQETMVVGQVVSSVDKSPIQQVNIQFKNTEKVVQTNEEGYFLIKTTGNHTTLVFSCVGYKRQEIKIKQGQSVGMDVQLDEENTYLRDALVIPGTNPAIELMRKVRWMKKVNDISQQRNFSTQSTEQNLVLLSKISQKTINKRVFNQLKTGNLSKADSSLILPLYMAENKFQLTSSNKKELSRNIFSSSESTVKIIEKLIGEMNTNLNFYENSVSVYGKSIVSPLANIGNIFYEYYLADSLKTISGKQYEIHFRTKNAKNLAFNGKLWIDSATFALTRIEGELPTQANINFIHNLHVSEVFSQNNNKFWTRQSENLALNMNFELLADSSNSKPEIFIKHNVSYHYNDSLFTQNNAFAASNYTAESLNEKLKNLTNTPILRTAKWIADAAFTGYMQVGKIDIGKIQQIMRLTDIEGFRLTLPLRTNEKLWPNLSLGGFVGYGFKNQETKYSFGVQIKMPGEKRRIMSMNYTNDYRRIDYNYNDFLFRENPLVTGDEDISSSIFASRSAGKMSGRSEISYSLSNEWNSNIESCLYIRSNRLFANASMPMELNGVNVANSLLQQSVTISTRFSFGERKYDDHMQRIYIANNKPVIYSILEAGNYHFADKSGSYAKIMANISQNVNFDFGQLNYLFEAGYIIGNVPYPLLEIPPGCESGGYGFFSFNMMNYMEYGADKYLNNHTELIFNGLILNQIPLIKELNLREMCSFNMAYGSLSDSHKLQFDYPIFLNPLNKPYMEIGVGVTNIFHLFTLQSVWRLSDLNRANIVPWGFRGCLSLSF